VAFTRSRSWPPQHAGSSQVLLYWHICTLFLFVRYCCPPALYFATRISLFTNQSVLHLLACPLKPHILYQHLSFSNRLYPSKKLNMQASVSANPCIQSVVDRRDAPQDTHGSRLVFWSRNLLRSTDIYGGAVDGALERSSPFPSLALCFYC
jgi:hypothetical protein